MVFRFRKRIRIVKGLWINLSKHGGSLSVGGHGVTANISKKGVRETVGLPGTGISYQTKRAGIGQQHRSAKRLRQSAAPESFDSLTQPFLASPDHMYECSFPPPLFEESL